MLPIVITEKININSKEQIGHVAYRQSAGSQISINENDRYYSIVRNAVDDTYNLEFPRMFHMDQSGMTTRAITIPYANVNNNLEFIGASPIAFQLEGTSLNMWKIHHSLLKDTTFRKTSMVAMGEDAVLMSEGAIYGKFFPIYRNINFLSFESMQNNIKSDFDQVIQLDAISRIDFPRMGMPSFQSVEDGQNLQGSFTLDNIVDKSKIYYSHIFIKSKPLDVLKGNQDVAEIYACEDNQTDLNNVFMNINNATMKSSAMDGAKLSLYFEKYNGPHQTLDINLMRPKLLGTIKVADSTYYDYASGKVKIGFAPHSIIGETIPYNYRGDYTRELSLDINGVFQNMKIAFTKKIEQPLLGSSNGLVKLNIVSSTAAKQVIMHLFTPEDIKIIRKNDLDLIGLERLSADAI